jgi:AcrR family transcriptional regulator
MELVHRQGVHGTTLAEIAEAADVAPGNVYYYFKTRDDLVRAVIGARIDWLHAAFAEVEGSPDPRDRLKAFIRVWADGREILARYGCPMATLCSDLGKIGGGLDREAAKLFEMRIEWMQAQFGRMGRADRRELAITLLTGIEGANVLAQALRDPGVITDEAARLDHWIDSLA